MSKKVTNFRTKIFCHFFTTKRLNFCIFPDFLMFQPDPSIQEQVNIMLMGSTDPSAQEQVIGILQEVSQIPEFPIYLFNAISNPNLEIPAKTAAANLLRHNVSKIPIQLRKTVKEICKTIFQPCFQVEDISFVNSISALIAELVREIGVNQFMDLTQTVNGLFADESTYFAALSLLYELSVQNQCLQGEFISFLPQLVYSEDYQLAFGAAKCIEELANHIQSVIKDTCILPIITNESITGLDESILVKIIVAVGSILENEGSGYEVPDDEKECMMEFIKACITSENNSLSIPAISVYEENPTDFDADLCGYLYTKLSDDADLDTGEISLSCKYLLTTFLEWDQASTTEFLSQLITENIGTTDVKQFRSCIRSLSFLAPNIEDVSEIVPAILTKISTTTSIMRSESIICLGEIASSHPDIIPQVLEVILPFINDADEGVRKQTMLALQLVFESDQEYCNSDVILTQFLPTLSRLNTPEGCIILETLEKMIENSPNLEETDKIEPLLQNVLPLTVGVSENEPIFVSCLELMEQLLNKMPQLIQPIIEFESLVEKLITLLSQEQTQEETAQIEFNGEAPEEAIAQSTMYDTNSSKIVNFFSAALKAQHSLETDAFNEPLIHVAQYCCGVIHTKLAHILTKIASWEYLATVITTGCFPPNDFIQPILEAASEEEGIDNDDDLLGNIAYLLFQLLPNIENKPGTLKTLLFNMSNALLHTDDDLNMKNIALCIMCILAVLGVPNVQSIPENPQGTDDKLQYVISLIEMQEDAPEQCIALCQQFKAEEE